MKALSPAAVSAASARSGSSSRRASSSVRISTAVSLLDASAAEQVRPLRRAGRDLLEAQLPHRSARVHEDERTSGGAVEHVPREVEALHTWHGNTPAEWTSISRSHRSGTSAATP